MAEWFRAHPLVLLLLPLVAVLVVSDCYHWPLDLLRDTDVPYLGQKCDYCVTVEDYPSERAQSWRYEVSLLSYRDSTGVLCRAHEHAYVYIRKDSTTLLPTMGDTLWVRTTFHRPARLGDFDYATYLRRQGIVGTGYVTAEQWHILHRGHPTTLTQWARYAQSRLFMRYRQMGITEPELGTLAALTLGYREDLDDDVRRSFQRAGATHVLAVSGLHTGMLYWVMASLLTVFGCYRPLYHQRWKRILNGVLILIGMWAYAFLTGMTPSVVRAVIMVSMVQAAYMCYRRPIMVNNMAAAAFLILCFRPLDFFSVSFQLSFAAVTAIVVLEPYLRSIFPACPFKKDIARTAYSWVVGLFTVSVAAQIGTLPLTLYYFGQTTYYFILTNAFVLLAAAMLFGTAIVGLMLCWLPGVDTVVAALLRGITYGMNHYVGWVEQLPGCVQQTTISAPMVGCYFAAAVSAYCAFRYSYWWFMGTGMALAVFCMMHSMIINIG